MKVFLFIISFVLCSFLVQAQAKIGENKTLIQPGSLLELESSHKGFLNVRMNTADMLSIPVSAASNGMMIYNTDSACLVVYDGAFWKNMCKGKGTARQYKITYTANAGDALFNAPQIINDAQDVQVFRNGVQVNFTAALGTTSLTLEPDAVCKKDDEIKIVQFVNP